MNFNKNTAWEKFAQSGKICDYLQYKQLSQENESNEIEHEWINNKGAQNKQ